MFGEKGRKWKNRGIFAASTKTPQIKRPRTTSQATEAATVPGKVMAAIAECQGLEPQSAL
jgi:hypothetical protein